MGRRRLGPRDLRAAAPTLGLENSFVSSTGWVKPGETYPFRVFVKNFTDEWQDNVAVTVPAPPGVVFQSARAAEAAPGPSPSRRARSPGGSRRSPRARPRRSSSSRARSAPPRTRASSGRTSRRTASHDLRRPGGGAQGGEPRPEGHPAGRRLRDGPLRRQAVPGHPGRLPRPQAQGRAQRRAAVDASSTRRTTPGSTFNLYQEMSYGQLFPIGDVPRPDIASAKFDYGPGFDFSERDVDRSRRAAARRSATSRRPLRHAALPRPHQGRLVPAAGRHRVLRRRLPGLHRDAGSTASTPPAATRASSSTTRCRSPIRRSTTTTSTPTRTASSTSSWWCSPAAAATAPRSSNGRLRGRARTTTPGRTRPRSRARGHGPGDRACPATSSDDQLTDLEGTPQCCADTNYAEHADCAAERRHRQRRPARATCASARTTSIPRPRSTTRA